MNQAGQENTEEGDKKQNTYGGYALAPSKVGGNALAAKVGGKKSRRRRGGASKSVGGRRRSRRRGRKSRRSRK
jgi:hypothetical protein